ncbi:hypothetical protein [Acidithiobacillus sp. AMEEHan]|uniref:BlaI/MecI/CopY family transcriptional regulator n=1 Tax=Acidithiobacillus sp. AMEEHan TaxID=2994951 RepID=UPI0027E552BC|nr:hypothetical protein [Acidithiobacillus sp. AMEEHan]
MNQFRLPADDLEYEVFSALWELGAAFVRELHDELSARVPRGFTTTAKVVDRERSRSRNLLSRFVGANPQYTVAALVQAAEELDPSPLEGLGRAILEHKKSTGQE